MEKLAQISKQREAAFDQLKALADKDTLTDDETKQFGDLETQVKGFDAQIARVKSSQELAAKTATPVAGQEGATDRVAATVETDKYTKDKSLVIGGVVKMIGLGGGEIFAARQHAKMCYGENHPVTKALLAGVGASGGFMVPPDYINEVIELLRPASVIRAAGPRVMPMPRGTMTIPGQSAAASANYGTEVAAITSSQQTMRQIVATYKKLTALVPVSNDMMRYADPATDAFVRDDLVKVLGLRQDLAFILGDGTASTPRGFLSFANGWVQQNSGTVGVWSTTANATLAVNGTDPANSTGGNFVSSTSAYTLATVANELGGAVNRLDTANAPDGSRCWFFHPRIFNYLNNVQNSLGVYVFRDELSKGTLLGYPFKKTTQIGANYWDATGTNRDLSFVFLVAMDEAMILDSMQLELAVSREGSYVDAVTGSTVSAFQNDQTLIRAIAEHDFQMRHDQSVAVIQAVRWAPAIS